LKNGLFTIKKCKNFDRSKIVFNIDELIKQKPKNKTTMDLTTHTKAKGPSSAGANHRSNINPETRQPII
jgi:hypothetical protein